MWKIPSGETKTFQGSNARNTCGTLTADGQWDWVVNACLTKGLSILVHQHTFNSGSIHMVVSTLHRDSLMKIEFTSFTNQKRWNFECKSQFVHHCMCVCVLWF